MNQRQMGLWWSVLAGVLSAALIASCSGRSGTGTGEEQIGEEALETVPRPTRRLWTEVEPLPPPEDLARPTSEPREPAEEGGEPTGEETPAEGTAPEEETVPDEGDLLSEPEASPAED